MLLHISAFSSAFDVITKARLFKYIEIFTTKKENFQIKYSDIFHISAQNIYCGYSLEPLRRGGFNKYPQSTFFSKIRKLSLLPQFYYLKVGFKGVNIIYASFRDVFEKVVFCMALNSEHLQSLS